MKLVTYIIDSQPRAGILHGNQIVDIERASAGKLPSDLKLLLEGGEPSLQVLKSIEAANHEMLSLSEVKLASPILNPSKIMAIGLNYLDHVQEIKLPMPELAIMFCKFSNAIIGHEDVIEWSPRITEKVDYEVELAVVIGKTARNVKQEDAMQYIAGYTVCNDVSARDLQLEKGDQWLRGKCLDTFCPLGPCMVTADEITDPHNLEIKSYVNGEIRQDSNTRHLIYNIPYLIEYLSEAFTLLPGDIIATGTPSGVGAFQNPPKWLQDGDEVIVEVSGIGQLKNTCRVVN